MENKDLKVTPTEIFVVDDLDESEAELRELSREELLHRLNFEESDPVKIKLIKKILKEKA